ncbi:MAG TPA: VWA domain-containing protein [Urbifossiella sp.]|jgi:Ca-activated chloride channel family protein|nr:VWA domain-containing protein [Urbifossiella sp.]
MSEFHFLRPWWLLALVPAGLLGWRLWAAADAGRAWRGVIAPDLLPHLLVGGGRRAWVGPVQLAVAGWVIATVALAGPAWEREPAPFADDTAVLVIVLKVTPSMQTADVAPTRLARATQKIHDLLALRPGAKTALVAYAGSAHRVVPPTADGGVIDTFVGELAPDVMPVAGDAAAGALTTADAVIEKTGRRGWVLWVADGDGADQTAALADYRAKGRAPVTVLAVAGDGPEFDSLATAAATLDAELVRITPDDEDVRRLAGNTRFSAAAADMAERWRDAGYWLVPVVAGLTLVSFRRGWVVRGRGA